MTRRLFLALFFVLLARPFFAEQNLVLKTAAVPQQGEYVLYVNGYDWGPAADKIVVCAQKEFEPGDILAQDFVVRVKYKAYKLLWIKIHPTVSERQVERAYLCDGCGNEVFQKSRYIALELRVVPNEKTQNPFTRYPKISEWSYTRIISVQNNELDFESDKCSGIVSPLAAQFSFKKSGSGDEALHCAYWLPPQAESEGGQEALAESGGELPDQNKSAGGGRSESGAPLENAAPSENEKIPLIVWFHGIAEAGKDPYIALLGTKTANLISPAIQKHFKDGAAVLVLQTSQAWLVTNERDLTGSKKWVMADWQNAVKNFLTDTDSTQNPGAVVSACTKPAKKAIDDFLQERPRIDKKRVYVGGCSAGGYMAMNMCLQFPEFFAAAFPTCAAYPNAKLTDAQIEALSKMNLWFTHSKDDQTIPREKYDGAFVPRIMAHSPANVHYVVFDSVLDLSGAYKDPDGNPCRYDGHESWIYVLNGQCADGGLSLFEWLSAQSKE